MEKIFDIVIPIGRFCGVIRQLDRLKLRFTAYPFDWLTSSLLAICGFIETDFEDFFDVTPPIKIDEGYAYIWNKYSGNGFVHHDISSDEIRNSFRRRIERWKKMLNMPYKILFFHETYNFNVEELQSFIDIIIKYYHKLDFHIIVAHEFVDNNIKNETDEYVEMKYQNYHYTLFKIHLSWLRQAMLPQNDRFYDTIFKSFNVELKKIDI